MWVLAAGCATSHVSVVSEGLPRANAVDKPTIAIAVVAADADVAGALVNHLAAELCAKASGPCKDLAGAMELASRASASRLIVCEVLDYTPYDPARLSARIQGFELAEGQLSSAEALRMFRSPPAQVPQASGRPSLEAYVDFDAAKESTLRYVALQLGLGPLRTDLLEVEVALRNPATFFRHAAKAIASAVSDRNF